MSQLWYTLSRPDSALATADYTKRGVLQTYFNPSTKLENFCYVLSSYHGTSQIANFNKIFTGKKFIVFHLVPLMLTRQAALSVS